MKILFKVIVLVIVLVSCIYLWKMFNGLHITKAQFAISYGLVILAGGLFVGWLTDFDFKNQSKYDDREKDPLSDWVKIQDRDKSKNSWGKFWNEVFGDPQADWLLDQMLQWELSNQYDRNELKSVEEIINKPADSFSVPFGYTDRKFSEPILVVDEVHKGNAETIKRIAEEVDTELRGPYQSIGVGAIVKNYVYPDETIKMPDYQKELIKGQVMGRFYRKPSNMPAWLFDEAGDAINPLDHEHSK